MSRCYACIKRGGFAYCGSDQCNLERRLEDIAYALNAQKVAKS